MVAAATYRQREVEDEDEEAVHESAAGGACGGRRMGNPSHTQTSRSPARHPAAAPKPAFPARGATPPAAREPGEEGQGAGSVLLVACHVTSSPRPRLSPCLCLCAGA